MGRDLLAKSQRNGTSEADGVRFGEQRGKYPRKEGGICCIVILQKSRLKVQDCQFEVLKRAEENFFTEP